MSENRERFWYSTVFIKTLNDKLKGRIIDYPINIILFACYCASIVCGGIGMLSTQFNDLYNPCTITAFVLLSCIAAISVFQRTHVYYYFTQLRTTNGSMNASTIPSLCVLITNFVFLFVCLMINVGFSNNIFRNTQNQFDGLMVLIISYCLLNGTLFGLHVLFAKFTNVHIAPPVIDSPHPDAFIRDKQTSDDSVPMYIYSILTWGFVSIIFVEIFYSFGRQNNMILFLIAFGLLTLTATVLCIYGWVMCFALSRDTHTRETFNQNRKTFWFFVVMYCVEISVSTLVKFVVMIQFSSERYDMNEWYGVLMYYYDLTSFGIFGLIVLGYIIYGCVKLYQHVDWRNVFDTIFCCGRCWRSTKNAVAESSYIAQNIVIGYQPLDIKLNTNEV